MSVLLCEAQSTDANGRLRVKETTSAVTEQLLTALRLPDQRLERQGQPAVACPAAGRLPSLIMLVDDEDRAVVVRQPLGSCHTPRQEVEDAVRGLTADTVTTYTVDGGR